MNPSFSYDKHNKYFELSNDNDMLKMYGLFSTKEIDVWVRELANLMQYGK